MPHGDRQGHPPKVVQASEARLEPSRAPMMTKPGDD